MSLRFGRPEEAGLDPDALDRARAALEAGIDQDAFPGAVALVARRSVIAAAWALGLRQVEPSRAMTLDAVFDLASLTKAICTAPVVLRLTAEGTLALETNLAACLPWTQGSFVGERTLRDLLTHQGGLPPSADIAWAQAAPERHRQLLLAIGDEPREGVVYSDLGFYLLGLAAEAATGESLGWLFERIVREPLGMYGTRFWPIGEDELLVPSEALAGVALRGIVHDGKARLMGAPTGHAGLFAPALDVATYAQALLDGGAGRLGRMLPEASVKLMLTAQTTTVDRRSLGLFYWGGRDDPERRLDLWGHTGFTGTSFALRPQEGLLMVLLTNRVHPLRRPEAGLKIARQRFHEAVLAGLCD